MHRPIVGNNSVRSCCASNRRGFLTRCAACAAAGWTVLGNRSQGRSLGGDGADTKVKVQLVFTHIPSDRPIWPNIGYDFQRRKEQIVAGLTRACPNIEFVPVTVMNADQAKQLLQKTADSDGYLVYMLGLWTRGPQVIGSSGRPTLFVDDLFGGSGEFLIANAAARRNGWKVECVSSSRFDDVVASVRCFEILKQPGKTVDDFLAACRATRLKNTKPAGDLACKPDTVQTADIEQCLARVKQSKILCVGRNPGGLGASIEQAFGTEVVPVEFTELHQAYLAADREEAEQVADRWITAAEKVIEPSRKDIVDSAAMYLAMKDLLRKHGAECITINCLGGFYGGHIKAYPCLGFSQLNNDRLVGACEADLRSSITMITMGHLVGRPGFISDPVIDTSKNEIIYAHCVAMTRPFGPEGPANPYHIRNHSEDRKGAAIRSLLPLGYMTTTLLFHPPRKEVILHQGKSVENIDEDMACRTKLAVEVKGSIDKLFGQWDQWGWHRVTFFGDLKEHVYQLADALGFRVVEEA